MVFTNIYGGWYKNQSSVISFEYNIIDNIKPTLTLNGDENIDVELGSTFKDLGATFNDNYDAQKIVYSTDIVDVNKEEHMYWHTKQQTHQEMSLILLQEM